ncbi:hypothetical protein KAH27_00690 [bacterium]|nr:hypothetical protein [bacterium]
MKKLFIFISLICLSFQGCDSGSKKNEDEVSLPEIKKSSTSTIENVKKAEIISETETIFETANRIKNIPDVSEIEKISDSTDQLETTTDPAAWKNEVSKKLEPIPLAAPVSQTVSSSGRTEKASEKTVNKKELMKARKLARSKSDHTTKKLDLSKESNFGKIQKVELETAK